MNCCSWAKNITSLAHGREVYGRRRRAASPCYQACLLCDVFGQLVCQHPLLEFKHGHLVC